MAEGKGSGNPVKRLEQNIETLQQIPVLSKEGFLNVGNHMTLLSSSFASSATRGVSIQERIDSAGDLGLTPLGEDLRKINNEILGVFTELRKLMDHKTGFSERMDAIVQWGLSLEQDAFLPRIVDQVKGGPVVELEVQTMGAVIDNLMQQTRPLIQEVVSACQESSDVMDHLHRRLTAALESSEHNLETIRDKTTATVRRMLRTVKKAVETCKTMETTSEEVNRVVFEMVQSMQYDDITTQRIEHSITTLRRAGEKIAEGKGHEAAIRWFVIALRITCEQIQETGADLVKAVQSMHMNLTTISDLGVDQIARITEARKVGMRFHQDCADITYHLGSLLRLGIFDDAISMDVLKTLSQAENCIFQAKRALDMLGMTATRLQKLTATIKTQSSGRLETLAKSILDLSERITREGKERGLELADATKQLQGISLDYSERVTPCLMRTSSMLRRVPLATQQMDIGNNDILQMLNENLGETQATATEIMLLSAEWTFHATIQRAIDHVVERLQLLIREVGGAIADSMHDQDVHALANEFDDLAALYTMESERRVHGTVLDTVVDDGSDPGDDFELF
ncbi:MAG: hypothetical protein HQL57_05465 [Magnetococcales bacterium]|nr:hypothetical protein [Magnetococcales bacterium]